MESELIAWLRRELPSHPCLRIGIGDDTAVLELANSPQCAVTCDLLTEGVHFQLAEAGPRRVGHKAIGVNLSDLAAMAATPLAAVIAISLPRAGGFELAKQLYEGILPIAEQFDLAIAGGDTNSWDGPLVISVTALGQVTSCGPLRRNGAQPGDQILVTGTLGGSILGRHLDVEPRVREALLLHREYELHAGIDISDGLAIDLSRVAKESDCGALVDLSLVPISDAACRLSARHEDGRTPLDHALSDGEDFELLLAVPSAEAERIIADQPIDVPIRRIGQFIAEPGLWSRDSLGGKQELTPSGFLHSF